MRKFHPTAAFLFSLLAHSVAQADDAKTGDSKAADSKSGADHLGLHEIAQGFHAIERWHVDEAREIAERAYREHPDYALTMALVADVKMHMSDYEGATSFYERARAAGAPDAVLGNLPLAKAAHRATEGYDEYVGEHFIVRYKPGKDVILVPYILETLEKSRERIGELLGWRPTARVVVEIYPNADTLAKVSTLTSKEISDSGTIALCRWNRLMVTSPRAVAYGYAWRDTLAHELTHLIIGGASNNTVPIWLHEGIAKFAETAWRADPGEGLSIEQQVVVREKAKKGELIPFEKMHPSMAKLKNQEETALAFAEVFTFIEFLVDRKGWDGMRSLLERMSEGASDEDAIEAVHGKPLKALAEEWMRRVKTREVHRGKGEARASEQKVVIKNPDTPDDRLHGVSKKGRRFARAADLLFARGRMKAAQKELEKAYKETGSALISGKLATVALAAGDLDAAENAARKATEGPHDLAGPNVTLAAILVQRGKTAEAKQALERAIAVNPFDPRIHDLLLRVLGPNGNKEERRNSELALAMLGGDFSPPVKSLGHGAVVQIEGPLFSRVYVARKSGEGERQTAYATGTVTPTPPLKIKPGVVDIHLVPPVGKEILRTVTIVETADGAAPQRIKPDETGS